MNHAHHTKRHRGEPHLQIKAVFPTHPFVVKLFPICGPILSNQRPHFKLPLACPL